LNTMTGKLVVEGTADLEAIRKLGKEENYIIDRIVQLNLKRQYRSCRV